MRIFSFASLLLMLAGTIHAQSVDPGAVIGESAKRIQALRSVSSTITFIEHSYSGRKDTLRCAVKTAPSPTDSLFGCHFAIADSARGNFFAWDGATATAIYSGRRAVLRSQGMEARWLGGSYLARMLRSFPFTLAPYANDAALNAKYTSLGQQTLRDTRCQVIRVDYTSNPSISGLFAVLYLGVDDLLPRRKISGFTIDGKHDTVITDWSDLRTDLSFPDGTFTLKGPADYSVQKYDPTQPPDLIAIGSPAPDWHLTNAAGGTISLSSLRGKIVVLDFWATWCGPCKLAMPGLQKLHQEFGERDVAVLGIDSYERGSGDPVKFMAQQGYTYRLLLNGDAVAQTYHAISIPTIYVIGRDGRVLAGFVGYSEENEKKIADMVKGEVDVAMKK